MFVSCSKRQVTYQLIFFNHLTNKDQYLSNLTVIRDIPENRNWT